MLHNLFISLLTRPSFQNPKFPNRPIDPQVSKFVQNLNFSGSDKKIFGQNQNFSSNNIKNLGKVRNFRAATMINCQKWLPNLGADLFFKNTLILGQKLGNMRLIPREDLYYFFLENTMILEQNLVFVRESQAIFLSYPKSTKIS